MRKRLLGHTGLSITELGFGASPLGNEFGPVVEEEGIRAVHLALDCGINFFDTAAYYGRGLSEIRLGKALKGRRQDAIVATKCARFDVDRFDFSAASAKQSIDISLRRLGTDYVDILHVHDIEFGDKRQIIEETIPALREIQRSGKARFIGITGLSVRMLREVAEEAPVDCILSYCRYNLLNQDLTKELAPFTEQQGIGLINASPLAMGMLSETGPPPWHPAPDPVRRAGQAVVELCRRRGADASAVALQFAVSHPTIGCTLSGISNSEQVKANVRALEQPADPNLLAEIHAITREVANLMWITGKSLNH